MNELESTTYIRPLDKSQEAFLLAIELYNRPTIRYHAEDCCLVPQQSTVLTFQVFALPILLLFLERA